MSNRVTLQFTQFVNLNEEGKHTSSFIGYRIYDDYGCDYNNNYEDFKELKQEINKDTVLDFIEKNHNDYYESIQFANGFYFNDDWINLKEEVK